jgi:hypothetical protein
VICPIRKSKKSSKIRFLHLGVILKPASDKPKTRSEQIRIQFDICIGVCWYFLYVRIEIPTC